MSEWTIFPSKSLEKQLEQSSTKKQKLLALPAWVEVLLLIIQRWCVWLCLKTKLNTNNSTYDPEELVELKKADVVKFLAFIVKVAQASLTIVLRVIASWKSKFFSVMDEQSASLLTREELASSPATVFRRIRKLGEGWEYLLMV